MFDETRLILHWLRLSLIVWNEGGTLVSAPINFRARVTTQRKKGFELRTQSYLRGRFSYSFHVHEERKAKG